MHVIKLDERIISRSIKNKGARYAFTDIDPRRTAHLVIDMQNGFMLSGAALEVPEARNIVENINSISAAIRSAGGLNVFLRFTVDPTSPWKVYENAFGGASHGDENGSVFLAGRYQHALHDEVCVEPEDVVLDKTRYSAFTPGSSKVLELLSARDIDTVIITGTLTNCCCEATARDACQLDFRVLFVSDANAALTDEEHNSSLNSLASTFADIVSTEQSCELVDRARAAIL